MFKLKHLIFSLVASAGILVVFSSSAHAASVTVNSTDDTATQDDGDCTLREAINNVNEGSDTTDGGGGGDCVAGDGGNDTVILPAGTITLASDLPDLTTSIAIHGQGMDATTIDGDGQWRVFEYEQSTNDDTIVIHGLGVTDFVNYAIEIANASVDIQQVDINLSNSFVGDDFGGIVLRNNYTGANEVTTRDIRVHGLDSSDIDGSFTGFAVAGGNSAGTGSTNAVIDNITVDDLTVSDVDANSVNVFIISNGAYGPTGGRHTMNAQVSNITISDIESVSFVAAFGASTISAGGASTLNLGARNVTISNIRGGETIYGASSGLAVGGGTIGAGATATTTVVTSNVLVSNVLNTSSSAPANCSVVDLSALFGGTGTVTNTFSSSGGNLSDDTSCSSYFTQPTDQNNITSLASTLGTLGDYGGYVPTIPLLEGSPAIDAGVTVAGLTTDARGISRPLGNAYDSGAYESPFTKTVESTESLANTGQSVQPLGVFTSILFSLGLMLQLRRQNV
ncbi:CSLREA domain-containing protein [Candidatus Saccharibacteria bacterium]|nr:CSLREA domain-containing protein [Candidatus Saccharibacteria bacterium]